MAAVYIGLLLVSSFVLFVEAADPVPSGDKKVVCYYTNWSYKRVEPYSFTPDKVDPFLCTHIIYAFADIGFRNNLISSDPEFDFNRRAYANITGLKKKNKNLKVMVGIGGWSKGTLGFGRITANDTNRREFAKNAVRFIRGYNFDGLDLNWQHPTFREGGTPEDKGNYVLLAQILREEFEKEATQKNKPRLLLSIAISHHTKFLPAYDIPGFNNYMDFISVICYDYHFSYEDAVNHHSPLYSLEEDSDYSYDANVNINYTINLFKELADADKLVLGIPTYGRTYKLENPEDTALGSFADGPGDKGPITQEKGWFAHFEICNFVKNEDWTVVQTKPGFAGPYAYKGDQWVCYDDVDMIKSKTVFAKQQGLGGVMFWTIDYDDFLSKCGDTSFPLIRSARNELISFDAMSPTADYEDDPDPDTSGSLNQQPASDNRPVSPPRRAKNEPRTISTPPAVPDSPGDKKVVCYFTNWSYKRVEPYSFTPDKIDPFICTHIIYAFADIGFRNNLISSDPEFDFNRRAYANITGLKKKNKNLKVMVGIGGWSKGTLGFGRITANDTNRREFAKNAVRFIRGYNFDGLDLNWQHPTFREGGTPEDKGNYVLLAQNLREEFEKEAIQKNKPRLLLSIAISHHTKFLPAYDLPGFNNYMDFISVICYDYHFSYEDAVNHHSPLYSLEEDNDYNYDANVNINYTINYFKEFADADKLVLGIPAYGRTYKLENPENTALGSNADGAGDGGPITKEKGWFAHFEICNFVKNEDWTVVQTKPGYAGPYAYKGNTWVCYDDYDMIRTKASYSKQQGLGGVMFWTMDYDDYLGKCEDPPFPLIRAARDALISVDNMSPSLDDSEDEPESGTSISRSMDSRPPPRPSRPVRPVVRVAKTQPRRPTSVTQPTGNEIDSRPATPRPPRPTRTKTSFSLPSTPPAINPLSSLPSDRLPSVPSRGDEVTDIDTAQNNIVGDLIRLIEKAGGMSNFCKYIRQQSGTSSLVHRRSFNDRGDTENTLVFETPNLPPILVALSNSSIYIREVNVYHKDPQDVKH